MDVKGTIVVTTRGDSPNTFNLTNDTDATFDVNSDGLPDFLFRGGAFTTVILSVGDNRYAAELANPPNAGATVVPIVAGSLLGQDSTTFRGDWLSHTDNRGSSGSGLQLLRMEDAYIGVEFMIEDDLHYGWIQYRGYRHPDSVVGGFRIPVNTLGGFIDSWAYETEPGKAIRAGAVPEPSSLVLTFMGIAILIRRRR